MSDAVDIFVVLGGIANVVMAGAAVAALKLWRRQIAGASDHELAKRVSAAIWEMQVQRDRTLGDLATFRDPAQRELPFFHELVRDPLEGHVKELSDAAKDLEALEPLIAAQWGDTVQDLFAAIRHSSQGLVAFATVELYPEQDGVELHRLACTFPHIAPTYTGPAFKKAIDAYTKLAQEWLGVHLNRAASRAIDDDSLSARRRGIDEEIKRLGEPEQAAANKLRERLADDARAYARAQPQPQRRKKREQNSG